METSRDSGDIVDGDVDSDVDDDGGRNCGQGRSGGWPFKVAAALPAIL